MICTNCRCKMEHHERFHTEKDTVPYAVFWQCPQCEAIIAESDDKYKPPIAKHKMTPEESECLARAVTTEQPK